MRPNVVAIGGVVTACSWCAAGPLTPPPGPVMPTPFDTGVGETRIVVSIETTPGDFGAVYRITQPGSYVLDADVTAGVGQVGVEIDARDVRLDLNGFAIRGNGVALGGVLVLDPGDGLGPARASVRNGAIVGVVGVGVDAPNATLHLDRLDVADTGDDGVVAGPRSLIDRCALSDLGDDGIVTGAHARVTRSSVSNHDEAGFRLGADSVALGCVALSGRVGFHLDDGARAESCVSTNYITNGFEAGNRAAVMNCSAAIGFTGVRATGTGARIEGNQIVNSGFGIATDQVGNLIIRNVLHGNGAALDVLPGNTVGPLVDDSTITLIANPAANYSY